MDLAGVAATAVGLLIVAVTLWDVIHAVLHVDDSGIVGAPIQRAIWWGSVALARRRPRARRSLLALAGPVMIVVTFSVWIGLFVLGFALLYWPHLHGFRAVDEIASLGFVEALYFSGVTGTVLGYGDVTPTTFGLRVVSTIQAALGFALLSGIVTYVLSVVSGVVTRNALTIRLDGESGGTADGVELVIRCLRHESASDFRSRLHSLSSEVRTVHEGSRQFPLLDLFLRSRTRERDPERLLSILADAVLACRIVGAREELRSIRPTVEELEGSLAAMMDLAVVRYMGGHHETWRQGPTTTHEDVAAVEAVRRRLATHLEPDVAPAGPEEAAALLRLASRRRVFFAELDRVTGRR